MCSCNACPRECGANREITTGFCGAGNKFKIARAGLHFWEEPCISGTKGSGTIFFSGCSLKCVYCQNYQISMDCFGKEISDERLIEIFGELEAQGAHNINLVNPTHYALRIAEILKNHKPNIPVVYNTGGYDKAETIKKLDGLVDIYLTDIKYVSAKVSAKYSGAANYFDAAESAVKEMQRQVVKNEYDENGIMKKGLIVRHLILPGNISQAMKVLDWINENLPKDTVISLMSQYMPCGRANEFPTINRRLGKREYETVIDYTESLGFDNVYIQDLTSSDEQYIPPFDLSGV